MMNNGVLRDKVKKFLIAEIHNGNLQINKTINLAALSRKLDVSVTPIREALSQLEESQIIKAIPNRGFIVQELSIAEAKDLYETISQLEILALENSVFDSEQTQKLRTQQLKLQQAHTAKVRLKERFTFHDLLIENCRNKVLVQLLNRLKARILFYEQLLVNDASFYENTDNQNEGIIRAIEENNVPTAALILKMNWMVILEYLEKQLQTTSR